MSAENFIRSNQIRVFPCANRGGIYSRSARLTTEYNLVSIINKLVDQEIFVVSGYKNATYQTGLSYTFNLYGYVFDTTVNALLTAVDVDPGSLTGSDVKYICVSLNTETVYADGSTELQITTNEIITQANSSEIVSGGTIQGLDQVSRVSEQYIFTGLRVYCVNSLKDDDICILEVRRNKINTPDNMLLKFKTNESGAFRSVTINDGVIE